MKEMHTRRKERLDKEQASKINVKGGKIKKNNKVGGLDCNKRFKKNSGERGCGIFRDHAVFSNNREESTAAVRVSSILRERRKITGSHGARKHWNPRYFTKALQKESHSVSSLRVHPLGGGIAPEEHTSDTPGVYYRVLKSLFSLV